MVIYTYLKGDSMGKTRRLDKKHLEQHSPTEEELIEHDWKHNKPHKVNPEELSSKTRHGHFSKMHIWPIRNENKKGHKI